VSDAEFHRFRTEAAAASFGCKTARVKVNQKNSGCGRMSAWDGPGSRPILLFFVWLSGEAAVLSNPKKAPAARLPQAQEMMGVP
jgi:hypothetical protein